MTEWMEKHLGMRILAVTILTALAAASCTSTLPVTPLPGQPLVSFASSRFAGSGNCAVCHSSLSDSTGGDVSIDTHWRSTMMANSAWDPLWQAKVSSEIARNPELKALIEDKCATCHMPMARTQAVVDDEPVGILDVGFSNEKHALNALAMDGVSCSLCHQIQDVNLGQEESMSGHFTIDAQTPPPDRLIFGPFPQPFQNPMRMDVGFTPVQGVQTLDSALCAACHTLFTPYVDGEGNILGTFPEQTPYLEWEHSAYGDGEGRSCQQCHMPMADGPAVISNRPGGRQLSARSPFAEHHFVGGNAFMLRLLSTQGESLGLTAGTVHLDATLARTVNRLETATAELSIVHAQLDGSILTVVVETVNEVGHKLPSGFPSRRAWIHLTVLDANGKVVFESGRLQADGSIVGSDADEDGARYEPHYDLISSPDQVQIYEPIMQNSDGEVTYTLLRAASYAKDNRLLPQGFDKATAGEDVAVRGAADRDETFVGGSDRVTYQVDAKEYAGPFAVGAELLYQTVSYRFAQDLCEQDTPQIENLCRTYWAADHTPAVTASAQQTVR